MPRVRGLLLACHPVPTVGVTVIAGALAASVGLSAARVGLVIAVILTGQLSIGWSNDLLDADRDRRAGRTDKPLAAGRVGRAVVVAAVVAAVLATVALSVVLGGPAALAALLIVVCGWAYNLGLRSTVLSFVPYALAFGALPAVATLALPDHPLPAGWAIATGALLGVAAHLVNVLPDLEQDALNGIRGLPHRVGAAVSAIGAMLLVLAAGLALLLGPAVPAAWWRWVAFAVLVLGAGVGTVALLRVPGSRLLFRVLVVGAAAEVLLFAVSGTGLVASG